jgi:phenylacetate-coenzyme A ligase PaaK-like adenylate-forming protein
MAIEKLKKDLLRIIDETEDENLLSMVKEDIAFYQTAKNTDVTDGLSIEQLKELEQLSTEPEEKDTMTLNEFNKATDKWRTK